jgi:hypothetical protein
LNDCKYLVLLKKYERPTQEGNQYSVGVLVVNVISTKRTVEKGNQLRPEDEERYGYQKKEEQVPG